MKTILLFFILTILTHSKISAQTIYAPSIYEWKSPQELDSEYNCNSAAVYLINAHKIPDIFKGKTLSTKEKRKNKISKKHLPTHLYLSLALSNPNDSNQILELPLYYFNARNTAHPLYSGMHQGRVLNGIKDEHLLSKPFDITLMAKSMKPNSSNESAIEALKMSNKLLNTALSLTNNPLKNTQIGEILKMGAAYFDTISHERAINKDFMLPIIEDKDTYKYQLVSISAYQPQWKLNNTAVTPLLDNRDSEQILDQVKEELDDRYPYIIIARYKSHYVLPPDYSTNIGINQNYLDKRSEKIIEFWEIRKELEENLLDNIREAVFIKERLEQYKQSKKINQENMNALQIINSYFLIQTSYREELAAIKKDSIRKQCFEEHYQEAYLTFFEKLDNMIDAELDRARAVVLEYHRTRNLHAISIDEFGSILEKLSYYNELILALKKNNQSITLVTESIFYPKYKKHIEVIEALLSREIQHLVSKYHETSHFYTEPIAKLFLKYILPYK